MKRLVLAGLVALGAAASPTFSQSPSLDDVLRASRTLAARYGEEATLILVGETCEQRAFSAKMELGSGFTVGDPRTTPTRVGVSGVAQRLTPQGARTWQAELAVVCTPGLASAGYPWMEFRDVLSVDGQTLGADREQRLSRLFQAPEWSLQKAREITEESARFNIGSVKRNVNTPAVPLLVLHPVNERRFSFRKTGEEVIEKTRTWQVEYAERARPYLIGGAEASSCASHGTLWIDPATGEVLRAVLECGDSRKALSKITVTYRRHERLGLLLPVEMIERPESDSGQLFVEGTCRYSNYRRFETAGRLVIPK